jgi:exonuclease III
VGPTSTGGLYADASAHRILSDLSALMFSAKHRLVIAGDWNILHRYGEHGDQYYAGRYASVFDRAETLGLRFVGPQSPHGRQAGPWPAELPPESRCVPTYHHSRQTPATATRQLDFVFASAGIADRVSTRALNDVGEWGGSDHCRILIDVDV